MNLVGAPDPIGLWEFDDAQDPLRATVGEALSPQGGYAVIAGVDDEDGAVQIGVDSQYVCTHGIPANGGGSYVNRFSLLFDFRIPEIGPWYCFYQTNPANENDGDCFIRANDGGIGVGQTGYSSTRASSGRWQRLIVSVDHSLGHYRLYLDGTLILNGTPQAVDGRFSLNPTILLFADENGEDAPIDISTVAIYDVSLSDADAAELGTPQGSSNNLPPSIVPELAGPEQADTGESVGYQVRVNDLDQDLVQVRIDWGDGTVLSDWSTLTSADQPVVLSHVYRQPGQFFLRALARDEHGMTSAWTDLQSVLITGDAQVTYLTLPYLQNVKPNAITIMWELDAMVEGAVEYGQGAGYENRVSCSQIPSGFGTTIYKCLLTGLEPATTYDYRTVIENQTDQLGAFTTAPVDPADFSFSVWADSQGTNHGTYDEDPFEPTKGMLSHMAEHDVDLGIGVGDLAENGSSYDDTRKYYLDRVAQYLGRYVPWFAAWGNHDQGSDAVIRKFADQPSQERAGFTPGHGSYSFDYAGCHFICIDHSTRTADITGWLETDLQSPANQNARFTFLFIHVPPYCELWIDGDTFLRDRLVPLMETYGVDVCFSGHTHEYSRGYLNGVFYCITGGGSWLDLPEVLVWDWPHMIVGGHHEIPGILKPAPERGGGLINEYVRVDVSQNSFTATMIGFHADGTEIGVLDAFSMSTEPNRNPPATPWLTGPQEINVFESEGLILNCAPYSDPDPQDTHLQSVWRLSASADMDDHTAVILEGITASEVETWSVDLGALQPGGTIYASVRHMGSDGLTSAFAPPISLRLTPDPLYTEDFEETAEFELPVGWTAGHHTSVDSNVWDPEDPRSNTYLTWTVVSEERLGRVFGANRINAPEVIRGNSVYAESDHRAGVQLQHLTTPDFDLAGVTNVFLLFLSNYMQNQDSLAALEYSVDEGVSWLPALYWLDAPDLVLVPDESGIDAEATFTRVDPDQVPTAAGATASGGTYGEHILSRPWAGLGDFIEARVNDHATESKRLEKLRLPAADDRERVRFRFVLVGTSSWFWGLDEFSLYGTEIGGDPLRITLANGSADALELNWAGPDGPYQIQFREGLHSGLWQNLGDLVPGDQRSIRLSKDGSAGFYRIRIVR